MRKVLISLLLILFISLSAFTWIQFSTKQRDKVATVAAKKEAKRLESNTLARLRTKSRDAKIFAQEKGFNSSICFLVDMSLPSGTNRFFIYDLKKDTIYNSALVTHGRCNQEWLEGRKYDNTVGSGCTSLGKYKIGYSYSGRFGLAFKLYGLEETNSNAFKRYVVLHSHECVPESEVNDEICQSDGCPTISPGFLKHIEPMIKKSQKPLLLWIFS